MLASLFPFAISLLIGLLLGLDRERNISPGMTGAGIRTFILIALLGTTAATLNKPLITFSLSLFVFAIIFVNYYRAAFRRDKQNRASMTTELAASMTFLLGYMVTTHALNAIIISAVILLALMERKRLHYFSKKKVQTQELEALILLIIFGLGIVPLLPYETIDHWDLFNPRNFALLITVIAAMQFSGYLAVKFFGQTLGRAILGFFGGLVSSTAVFVTLKDNLRSTQYTNATMASAILATTAMILEFAAILLTASTALLVSLLAPLTIMLLLCIIISGLLVYRQRKDADKKVTSGVPIKLSSVVISAIFIGLMLIVIVIAKRHLGIYGAQFIAFVGGLFELHAVTLATALLYLDHNLNITQTTQILSYALLAAFISKFIILWALTPRSFALRTSIFLGVILGSGIIARLLT